MQGRLSTWLGHPGSAPGASPSRCPDTPELHPPRWAHGCACPPPPVAAAQNSPPSPGDSAPFPNLCRMWNVGRGTHRWGQEPGSIARPGVPSRCRAGLDPGSALGSRAPSRLPESMFLGVFFPFHTETCHATSLHLSFLVCETGSQVGCCLRVTWYGKGLGTKCMLHKCGCCYPSCQGAWLLRPPREKVLQTPRKPHTPGRVA